MTIWRILTNLWTLTFCLMLNPKDSKESLRFSESICLNVLKESPTTDARSTMQQFAAGWLTAPLPTLRSGSEHMWVVETMKLMRQPNHNNESNNTIMKEAHMTVLKNLPKQGLQGKSLWHQAKSAKWQPKITQGIESSLKFVENCICLVFVLVHWVNSEL